MRYDVAGVIALLAIAAYLLFFNKPQGTSQNTTLPQGMQDFSTSYCSLSQIQNIIKN